MIKETGIPFSPQMVQAILDGRKTMTRRIIKQQPPSDEYQMSTLMSTTGDRKNVGKQHWINLDGLNVLDQTKPYFTRPYYAENRLWVREAWRTGKKLDYKNATEIEASCREAGYEKSWAPLKFETDGLTDNEDALADFGGEWGRYRHARFMPRWASRITLEITGVRVERLNDISREDAIQEGLIRLNSIGPFRSMGYVDYSEKSLGFFSPIESFQSLWEKINGEGSWDLNPFVWCVSFKKVSP